MPNGPGADDGEQGDRPGRPDTERGIERDTAGPSPSPGWRRWSGSSAEAPRRRGSAREVIVTSPLLRSSGIEGTSREAREVREPWAWPTRQSGARRDELDRSAHPAPRADHVQWLRRVLPRRGARGRRDRALAPDRPAPLLIVRARRPHDPLIRVEGGGSW